PGVNHPAWILAHLAFPADRVARVLGADMALPDDWHTRFGPGSKVSPAREDYPGKDELLRAVEQCFARARELATAATPEQLSRTTPTKCLKDQLPTVGDAVAFLLTGHLGLHLGQLSSWRRMIGLAPMF